MSGTISQYFGKTSFSWRYSDGVHTGLDIAAPYGTPIYASQSGTIVSAKYDGGYGNCIRIQSGDYLVYYGHMSKFYKTSGWVEKGELIGYVGSTGYSTGPHLHWEIRLAGTPQNPLSFV